MAGKENHTWKKILAIVLVCIAIAFGIASLTSNEWITDKNRSYFASASSIEGPTITYKVGLQSWSVNTIGCDGKDLDWVSTEVCPWPTAQLGNQQDYNDAGAGCLGAGSVGVAFSFLALLIGTVFIIKPDLHRAAPAITAWISGFTFILGALIYEGKRPTLHGNAGYDWPMGLFLIAGCLADVAAFFFWWAGQTPK